MQWSVSEAGSGWTGGWCGHQLRSPGVVAVLDDYQGVAASHADWATVAGDVDFHGAMPSDPDDLIALLQGYDVIVAMRERTPFPRSLLAALPELRLHRN